MTALAVRPVKLRLAVAFVCDAACGGFSNVNPGSSLERFCQETEHPYATMWNSIGNFYQSRDWHKRCDESLKAEIDDMAHNGFTTSSGNLIIPEDIKAAAQRWKNYQWYDYEMKRAAKWKTTKSYSKAAVLALGVFNFLGNDS
jgi:hypothetical protein